MGVAEVRPNLDCWRRSRASLAVDDTALDLCGRYQIGYYDAAILAAARLLGCAKVHSEDLNDGQDYDGVQVENPFRGIKAASPP